MKAVIDLCELYHTLNSENLSRERLQQVYADNIVFTDPLHHVEGLDALLGYFAKMYQNVSDIRFEFGDAIAGGGEAALPWTMTFSHHRLAAGRPITVNGISHLRYDDKVWYHRDYFDSAQMLYRQLPVLGPVCRWLDKRVQ